MNVFGKGLISKLLILSNSDILILDYDGTLLNTIEHTNVLGSRAGET